MKVVEKMIKDLEYYINFVDKEVANFERTYSNFERSSVDKCCQNHCITLRNHS